VIPNVAKTGTVTGISFVLDGERMKGSDLGKKFTWNNLITTGVNYDKYRHAQTISDRRIRSQGQAGPNSGYESRKHPDSQALSRRIGAFGTGNRENFRSTKQSDPRSNKYYSPGRNQNLRIYGLNPSRGTEIDKQDGRGDFDGRGEKPTKQAKELRHNILIPLRYHNHSLSLEPLPNIKGKGRRSAHEMIQEALKPYTDLKLKQEEERKRKEKELKRNKERGRTSGMDIDF